jgi:hypothetical protein
MHERETPLLSGRLLNAVFNSHSVFRLVFGAALLALCIWSGSWILIAMASFLFLLDIWWAFRAGRRRRSPGVE